eukprot:gene8028-biopygen278
MAARSRPNAIGGSGDRVQCGHQCSTIGAGRMATPPIPRCGGQRSARYGSDTALSTLPHTACKAATSDSAAEDDAPGLGHAASTPNLLAASNSLAVPTPNSFAASTPNSLAASTPYSLAASTPNSLAASTTNSLAVPTPNCLYPTRLPRLPGACLY